MTRLEHNTTASGRQFSTQRACMCHHAYAPNSLHAGKVMLEGQQLRPNPEGFGLNSSVDNLFDA